MTTFAYTHSVCGDVTAITDPAAHIHRFGYDSSSCFPTTCTDPAGSLTRYGYDLGGTRIAKITDPKGIVTNIGYDAWGRVTSIARNTNGPTTTVTYNDGKHRVTKVVDALGCQRSAKCSPNSDLENASVLAQSP